MPIINRQDAAEVEQYIARFFAAPPSGRAQALRRLFLEKLDFSGATGAVSLANASYQIVIEGIPHAQLHRAPRSMKMSFRPPSRNPGARVWL